MVATPLSERMVFSTRCFSSADLTEPTIVTLPCSTKVLRQALPTLDQHPEPRQYSIGPRHRPPAERRRRWLSRAMIERTAWLAAMARSLVIALATAIKPDPMAPFAAAREKQCLDRKTGW